MPKTRQTTKPIRNSSKPTAKKPKVTVKLPPAKPYGGVTEASSGSSEGKRRFTPFSFRSRRKRRQAERIQTKQAAVPNAFKLMADSLGLIIAHWEIFGGTLAIYGLLNLLLLGGINGIGDLQTTKDNLTSLATGGVGKLVTGLSLFGFLVSSGTGTASGVASAYQAVALLVVSLALVWACRQLYAKQKIRIRDGFYQGMYPLIPAFLVLLMIGLQLLPALIGLFLYTTLISGGIIIVVWQQVIVATIIVLLVVLSVYWVLSSLFALYIVTLPAMTPLAALRSARDIVRFRRVMIVRKLLFLVFALMIPAAIILVPVSVYLTIIAVPIFFVMTVITVGLVHAYLYTLYRALIAE